MNRCYATVWLRLALVCTVSGCAATPLIQAQREAQGRVFYVDGAGGGGLVVNWGRDVRGGLQSAGFQGVFCEFSWQTGLGIVADQVSSASYKQSKGRELASLIYACRQAQPGQPVHLIGFSAGTAVAVHALEALPPGCCVDNVVLMASSLSSRYDLTAALQHVRGRAYVFVSPRDLLLRCMVPAVGTADRVYCGQAVAGLCGFEIQPDEGADKIETITWAPPFVLSGNRGGHTDVVHARFVQEQVTPRLCTTDEIRLAHAGVDPR